jgi:hypothetical protein
MAISCFFIYNARLVDLNSYLHANIAASRHVPL